MNKKKKIIIFTFLGLLLAAVLCFILLVYIPYKNEQKRLEEEARIAAEIEAARQEKLSKDAFNLCEGEYDTVFLSMTESTGWPLELTLSGYIGLNPLRAEGRIDKPEELRTLISSAFESGNPISNFYMIIDPYKLYSEVELPEPEEPEKKKWFFSKKEEEPEPEYFYDFDFESLIGDNPDIEFRIFFPFYGKEYWNEFEEKDHDKVITRYNTVMDDVLKYDNAVLAAYPGEDWLIENPGNYLDYKAGDLKPQVFEKLFLYSYTDNWTVNELKEEYVLKDIEKNCLGKNERQYYPLEDCDIVFLGDSIFALADGPFSIASVVNLYTGARTYNMSKGGMCTARYSEDTFDLVDAAHHFADLSVTGNEEFSVFDGAVTAFANDDHTGRKLIVVMDSCTNDYIGSVKLNGTEEASFEGALNMAFSIIKEAYPEAELYMFSPYYMQLLYNGTVKNANGNVLDDYRDVMSKVCEENGVYYFNMQDKVKFNGYSALTVLDDGTHPSPEGCYRIAEELAKILAFPGST